MWTFVALFLALLLFGYYYVKSKHNYWRQRGVAHPEPTFLFGNILKALTMEEYAGDIIKDVYRKFPDYKYVGFYKLLKPVLIVRDPELVRRVLVKDFDHFEANDVEIEHSSDDISGLNPFVLRGAKWKDVRAQLTPNFTALKLKKMFPLIQEVCDRLVNYINANIDKDLEAKDVAIKFTTENIASCAFGLNGQAFENTESQFVNVAKDFGSVTFLQTILIFIFTIVPSLSKILKIKFWSQKSQDYLSNAVRETLKYRQENGVIRHDFLDMMKKIEEKRTDFTTTDIIGHSATFFADGVETSGVALSSILFELAAHPDVQQKLYEEIQSVLAKYQGELSYEVLQDMNYLDCVFNESLRLNPIGMFMLKLCTKSCVFPAAQESGNDVMIEEGVAICIPVAGLHEDPSYYPEPQKFKPERFSEENKEDFVKGTYLAFGDGPRICLGMRFGLFQLKMAVVALVVNFVMVLNEKTKTSMENHSTCFTKPAGDIWIDFKKRK